MQRGQRKRSRDKGIVVAMERDLYALTQDPRNNTAFGWINCGICWQGNWGIGPRARRRGVSGQHEMCSREGLRQDGWKARVFERREPRWIWLSAQGVRQRVLVGIHSCGVREIKKWKQASARHPSSHHG